MPPIKGNSVRRRRSEEERRAAIEVAKEILKDPRMRATLISKHPRLNRHYLEEEQEEVLDVAPSVDKKPEWNPEEALKILDSLYGKAIEINEDPQELEDIANRNYKWRTSEGE
ncbi:hypothetical protein [Bacillus sp. USDA818B3_A]|uniref:hypothetical protein n=1 Tax=Bacillus sp. USDA818B3_A TaxID=2698834 RepID=UPI00136CE534|nr:hypothetical protein [Bacillus sp. USDA818B3_A]